MFFHFFQLELYTKSEEFMCVTFSAKISLTTWQVARASKKKSMKMTNGIGPVKILILIQECCTTYFTFTL